VRKNRSKENKLSSSRSRESGQTGQTGRTNVAKREAKLDKLVRSGSIDVQRESLSASASAQLPKVA
jgi:hypothetical protein